MAGLPFRTDDDAAHRPPKETSVAEGCGQGWDAKGGGPICLGRTPDPEALNIFITMAVLEVTSLIILTISVFFKIPFSSYLFGSPH